MRMLRNLLIHKLRKLNHQEIQQIQKVNPIHCWKKLARKGQKKSVKRKGRKYIWKETLVTDLVDIILENDTYGTKLLLTNMKNAKNRIYCDQVVKEINETCRTREEDFPFNISQTREKFQRYINIFREAAMKIKTKSCIQSFQEEKNYGVWFGKLMPFVPLMYSCQPQ